MSEGHDFDPTTIPGNATIQTKLAVSKWISVWQRDNSYGDNIGSRVRLTEISIDHKSHQPEKLEGKVVAEIHVTEDMINYNGILHGGCIMYLVDILSPMSVSALACEQGGSGAPGVTQAIHTIFHAPARLGAHLKIINTSLSIGGRTTTSRCEIWDTTNHRLVASAVQVRMQARL